MEQTRSQRRFSAGRCLRAAGLLAIGCLGGLAQTAAAQVGPAPAAGAFGWLGSRDERFRDPLQALLVSAPTRDLDAGWLLAAELGRPAVPLCWELVQAEKSNLGRRLGLVAAAAAAGGIGGDEWLLDWLGQPQRVLEERCFGALLLALGPRRSRPVPDLWSRLCGESRAPQELLALAARLAAARFPGSAAAAPGWASPDPGHAAAAAFAGLPVPPAQAKALWQARGDERHAELFWRGAWLGAARQAAEGGEVPADLLQRAREWLQRPGDQDQPAARAAAVLAMRGRDVRADGRRPSWRILQLLAADTATARALRPWLTAAPQSLDDEPQRLAVAYVLSREPDEVLAERGVWAADPRIKRHVAIALAWRLLGDAEPRPIEAPVADLPEWAFVGWASGGPWRGDAPIDDPVLAAAAAAAAEGRLPRPVARRVCEEALWRWGSHPGLGALENERLLLRDLLLVGSHPGGSKYVPHVRPEQRYRPTGLGPDSVFFDVAVAWFDHRAAPRPPVPSEYRLR